MHLGICNAHMLFSLNCYSLGVTYMAGHLQGILEGKHVVPWQILSFIVGFIWFISITTLALTTHKKGALLVCWFKSLVKIQF